MPGWGVRDAETRDAGMRDTGRGDEGTQRQGDFLPASLYLSPRPRVSPSPHLPVSAKPPLAFYSRRVQPSGVCSNSSVSPSAKCFFSGCHSIRLTTIFG